MVRKNPSGRGRRRPQGDGDESVPGPKSRIRASIRSHEAPPPKAGEERRAAAEPDALARVEARLERLASLIEKGAGKLAAPLVAPQGGERGGRGELDDVATAVRRAAGDVLDRKLEEIIPAVAGLYQKLLEESRALSDDPEPLERENLLLLLGDVARELGGLLRSLGGSFLIPEVGEPYDPLIHLAVGEACPAEGEAEVVAEVVRPGYKSGRGRVVLPARVLVGPR